MLLVTLQASPKTTDFIPLQFSLPYSVCGLEHTFNLIGWLPSVLYTFLRFILNLARYYHFTGFTEFESIIFKDYSLKRQFLTVRSVSLTGYASIIKVLYKLLMELNHNCRSFSRKDITQYLQEFIKSLYIKSC